MNQNPFTELKKHSSYSLTESERMAMRTHLIHRMHEGRKPQASTWYLFILRPMPLAALALIVTVSSTSVSFAAGGALPGDILYPVKVAVNEKVELALAVNAEARANVRVRQAEERLKETEVLAVRGELSPQIAQAAAEVVAENVDAALAAAIELQAEGDVAAAGGIETRIASALSAHSDLLDAHAENFDDSSSETLRTLSFAVRDAAGSTVRMDDKPQDLDDGRVRALAEAARARAQARIETLMERIKDNGIPDETEAALTDEYARLSADLTVSEELALAEDYQNAANAYDDIDRRAYRALTLLSSAQKISSKTDQEVVIVLGEPEHAAATMMMDAPMARQAKVAEPEAATMMMSLEATTSEEANQDAALLKVLENPIRLEFRIRKEEK